MKIALIEDEPDCYETFTQMLEDRGHEVLVYTRADDAVEALKTICKCDLIILDLMMRLGTKIDPSEGDETGTALYKRIRKLAPTVCVMVVTAKFKGEWWWKDFSKDKNVSYLGKPLTDFEWFHQSIQALHSRKAISH